MGLTESTPWWANSLQFPNHVLCFRVFSRSLRAMILELEVRIHYITRIDLVALTES